MIQRKTLLLALKGAVSLGLIVWVLSSVGIDRAVDRLTQVSPGWFLLAMALGALQFVVCAFRWRAVMDAFDVPPHFKFSLWLRFFYLGLFFNQALPSTVGGDAVRAYKAHQSGLELGSAIGGVLIDRIMTVIALLALVAFMASVAGDRLGAEGPVFVVIVWLMLLAGIMGTAFLMLLDRIPARFAHLPGIAGMAGFAADIRRTLLAPKRVMVILAWAVLAHINLALVVWTLAQGISADLALFDTVMLFPLALLMQTLPISIAGWGVREGAMIEIFALVALPADAALAISLLFGIAVVLLTLPGGIVWVRSGIGRKPVADSATGEGG